MTEGNLVHELAAGIGVGEPALRLILSIFLGYPLAYVYRKFIFSSSKLINHLFIITTGLCILYFNYGFDLYHVILAIFVEYILIHLLSGSVLTTVSFVFHLGYLLVGYYYTSSETYDIKWTMPHCVLVLRLIGLSFDVADGQRPPEKLSTENKKTCLDKPPGLLEVYSFALFPASLLIGPQFPFRRYNLFINKEFGKYTGNMRAGLIRGGIGLIYLIVHQVGAIFVYDDFLLSQEYADSSYIYKLVILGIWGRVSLYKYISCWLLAEGVASCFGLTFVAVKNGKGDWSGCANINLYLFENCSRFQDYISSFNINTNHWVAEYVFKRLKFLNNRHISHGATLLFLAVWHGFHSGYYMCFLMEFIVMNFEKEIETIFKRNESFMRFCSTTPINWLIFIVLKLYTIIGMGWSLTPFILFDVEKWWHIFWTVRMFGFILFVPWPLYGMILRKLLPPTKSKEHSKKS